MNLLLLGGSMGKEIERKLGTDMDTLLYLTWRTSKDLLSSTGNCAQCYKPAWMGGKTGGERIDIYAESIGCSAETITTLLIRYTPI